MSMRYPRYQVVMIIDPPTAKPFGLLETVETWSGPRTYIRQVGFESAQEVYKELLKRGKQITD